MQVSSKCLSGTRQNTRTEDRDNYKDNYSRLASIKKQYDPGNLFHLNQNIPPAS